MVLRQCRSESRPKASGGVAVKTHESLIQIAFVLGLCACSAASPTARDGVDDGNGSSSNPATGSGPGTGPGTGPGEAVDPTQLGTGDGACDAVLPAVYRDFKGFGEPGGHPDFEISARGVMSNGELYKGWNDVGCGMVEPALGGDTKPVFYGGPADVAQGGPTIIGGVGRQTRIVAGPGCWPATSGVCYVGTCAAWDFNPPTYDIESATTFGQWYTTVSGVNMEVPLDLTLAETAPGSGVYVYDSNAFFPLDGQGFG